MYITSVPYTHVHIIALDAAARGLKVACVEREDIASGTSSRSTKLIWGGSRYLIKAFVTIFSSDLRLIISPVQTMKAYVHLVIYTGKF